MYHSEVYLHIIETYQIIFDMFPELNALPVYVWGRLQKYEGEGELFECNYWNEFINFERLFYGYDSKINFDWELIKLISYHYDIVGMSERFELMFSRQEYVDIFQFDSQGGRCLVITKDDFNGLKVVCVDCDSPE